MQRRGGNPCFDYTAAPVSGTFRGVKITPQSRLTNRRSRQFGPKEIARRKLMKSAFPASPFQFRAPDLAPAAGIFVTPTLLVRFRNHGLDFQVLSRSINGHKGQIR